VTRKVASRKRQPLTPLTVRAAFTGTRYALQDRDGRRHVTRAATQEQAFLLAINALGCEVGDVLECEVTGG
jgi:hypothetical protein